MGPEFRKVRCKPLRATRAFAACMTLAAVCALVPATAHAQATASADSRAAIIGPASMVKLRDMDFGKLAVFSTAGTVKLDPVTSACTITGNLIQQGTCKRAEFAVRGRRNDIVRIREQNGGVVTLIGPAGDSMTMTNFTASYSGMVPVNGGGNPSGNLGRYRITDAGGIGQFRVGGTLNVKANQTPGAYRGTFTLQVVYN